MKAKPKRAKLRKVGGKLPRAIMREKRTPANKSPDELKLALLEALSSNPNVTTCCEQLGIPRTTFYSWKQNDPEFLNQLGLALEQGTDALEDEAQRRGFQGTLKPVFQQGRFVGHVREYSDTLAIFMLKARRPKVFRDPVPEKDPAGGGNAPPPTLVINFVEPKKEEKKE